MRRGLLCALGFVGLAGCSEVPMNVVTTQGTITERVLITSTAGQVTRRLWCDGFSNLCIDGK